MRFSRLICGWTNVIVIIVNNKIKKTQIFVNKNFEKLKKYIHFNTTKKKTLVTKFDLQFSWRVFWGLGRMRIRIRMWIWMQLMRLARAEALD